MERVLLKLAEQLNSYDESSLMSLWEKYANIVHRFEPTRRWEEAVLVFCMIQGMHWKNQLFNYQLSQSAKPGKNSAGADAEAARFLFDLVEREGGRKNAGEEGSASGGRGEGDKTAKVLPFRPRDSRKP